MIKDNVIKVLLYNDKIFVNARSFYEFMLDNNFEGNYPSNWNLNYIQVSFSNRLNTISGISVDWLTVDQETLDLLKESEKGWIKWTDGPDKTFEEFIRSMNITYTREELWRNVIEYVTTYDAPRSSMKRLVDDVMFNSESVDKKNGVFIYKLKD